MPRYHTLSGDADPEDADDERSFSDVEDLTLPSSRRPRPAFPGQDVRPTSRKELMGWYSYAWAAEVFVVCGVGSFIPVTLEQLAREHGVLLSDESMPCVPTVENGNHTVPSGEQCIVRFLGWKMNTASFPMYTFSISVFIQCLLVISMSCAADHGAYRKRLLVLFAIMGSVGTMLFITVRPDYYALGALWAMIGNVGFGASFVLLNAFLPVLVRHHPKMLYGEREPVPTGNGHSRTPRDSSSDTEELLSTEPVGATSPLLGSPRIAAQNGSALPSAAPKASLPLRLSTQISSYGIAIGYAGAVLLQLLSILIVLSLGSTTASLKLVLFLIGLWWLIFTFPSLLFLRPRPGPPLPSLSKPLPGIRGYFNSLKYISASWTNLYKTFLRAKQLKDVSLFLIAWFLLSDGIATVSGTAVLFAKTNLAMPAPALGLISVVSTLSGVLGAFLWPRISRTFHLSPPQTILFCIFLFLLIPLYGLLGFLPPFRPARNPLFFGLNTPFEIYLLSAIYGFVMGGVSGYCRSVFGELIPPGSEAAFYALYAVTDKGSSIFGPTVVGLITDRTGDIRYAFWFLAGLLAAPVGVLWGVDVERGRREGRELARRELEETAGGVVDVEHL